MSRNNALLMRLNQRGRIKTFSGGRTIDQELNYREQPDLSVVFGLSGSEHRSVMQTMTAAEFPIRQSAVAVSISGLEELQNSGEEAIIDLLESRIENAEDTFMNGLSQGIYGDGTVTGSVGGLQFIVADSPGSGTVGGIDRATWTFWQNQSYSSLTDGGWLRRHANISST